MTATKRRLGRGLDTLLGQPREVPTGFAQIQISSIRPNPQQPRTTFEPAALAELEQSVRELGVLVPIIVRPLEPVDGEPVYELIAGERRWRAAAAAQLKAIPALVRVADDRASLELAVVENLQRQDLDPLEEAMGFEHLLAKYDYTQEALAERLGKSQSAVANTLRLLGLADPIKARLRSGLLTVGHARALLSLEAGRREALAERIVADGLSVRDVERAAAERPAKPRRKRALRAHSPDMADVENRLRYALGSHVAIIPARRGGRLEIRYSNDEELTRIIDAILPAKS